MNKPKWSGDKTITEELNKIIDSIGYFPSQSELRSFKRSDLINAIYFNGGIIKFRKLLGYKPLRNITNYWTEERILEELNMVVKEIGHFPSHNELKKMDRKTLAGAIQRNNGLNKFRLLFGYELHQKPDGYWTEKNTIKELELVINQLGHFPKQEELELINRKDLKSAVSHHGGLNKFRRLMGYDLLIKRNYWTDDRIKSELKTIINDIGHFPTANELKDMKKSILLHAINEYGGVVKFRILLGCDLLIKPDGYYTDDNIIEELKSIISEIGHFPSCCELSLINKTSLNIMISRNGGINKFRELLGYSVSMRDKYISELMSYTNKRGKKSEFIVKNIIFDYCFLHNIHIPQLCKKLSVGNVIEFICNIDKRIGIDVTNAKTKSTIFRKWTHKSYHLYLDELWIVVFSDSFIPEDYQKWNTESPYNVKVFSIYDFLKELDYSLDEATKSKIDKYCSCTFHTKDELMNKNT